jgi:hypothetical protein
MIPLTRCSHFSPRFRKTAQSVFPALHSWHSRISTSRTRWRLNVRRLASSSKKTVPKCSFLFCIFFARSYSRFLAVKSYYCGQHLNLTRRMRQKTFVNKIKMENKNNHRYVREFSYFVFSVVLWRSRGRCVSKVFLIDWQLFEFGAVFFFFVFRKSWIARCTGR